VRLRTEAIEAAIDAIVGYQRKDRRWRDGK
jgi:hypothetical protein